MPARPTTATLRGVWGIEGHYFAVGNEGTFLEFDGVDWTSNKPSAHNLNAIWGGAPSDVWAVGQDTLHWSGASWDQVPNPSDQELSGVWGSAPNDVWAVGKNGTLLHSEGRTWNSVPSPVTEDISGVWGSSTDDVWAVGAAGSILHFNGKDWRNWPTENFGPPRRGVWQYQGGRDRRGERPPSALRRTVVDAPFRPPQPNPDLPYRFRRWHGRICRRGRSRGAPTWRVAPTRNSAPGTARRCSTISNRP